MEADFISVILTLPHTSLSAEREAACISHLLKSGAASFVHLRKPDDPRRVSRLIELIPAALHTRLRIHRFPDIARRSGIGYHLADGEVPPPGLACTRSCHSLDDALRPDRMAYRFLSPIFNSISKPGYNAAFSPSALMENGLPPGTIGLGGVTPRSFLCLARMGFHGGAMLGWIWESADDAEVFETRVSVLLAARAMVRGFSLQFITSAPTAELTAAQAMQAMRGGCRWVQVRMKDAPDSEVREAISLIGDEALRLGAALIVDDRVELAASMPQVAGVHLGHNDMPRPEARSMLGPDKIIGSTANTPEQALALAPVSDYLGVGPFRFTTTKKKLAPLLGAAGIAGVCSALRRAALPVPVVAIGGILPADLPQVMNTGANGVAVSGAIHAAPSPEEATAQFLRGCPPLNKNNTHTITI